MTAKSNPFRKASTGASQEDFIKKYLDAIKSMPPKPRLNPRKPVYPTEPTESQKNQAKAALRDKLSTGGGTDRGVDPDGGIAPRSEKYAINRKRYDI